MDSLPPTKSPRSSPLLFTDFPEDVKVSIINCLQDIKEAGRTSILCKSFRHQWESIPDLRFGIDMPPSAIDAILLLHSGPIRSFNVVAEEGSSIPRWLASLSRCRDRSHLSYLRLYFTDDGGRLPSSIFSFQSLTSLKLTFCSLSIPPTSFNGFPCLKELDLRGVLFPDTNTQNQFISMCPELCSLTLQIRVENYGALPITNPKLRHFLIFGNYCTGLTFVGGQTLETVTLNINGQLDCNFAELFRNGAGVNGKLDIFQRKIKAIDEGRVPESIIAGLKHLTHFKMPIRSKNERYLRFLLCVIRSTPNLRKLHLSGDYVFDPINHGTTGLDKDFWGRQSLHQLDNLRILEFDDLLFWKEETDIIQFLLPRAPMLEKLIINHNSAFGKPKKRAFNKLKSYKRASSPLEIIYKI